MGNAIRVRKSVKLTKQQHSILNKWVMSQETKLDAAQKLGIARQSLHRILLAGSGSQESISKILETVTA